MSYATSAHTVFDQMLGTLEHLLGKAADSDQADAHFGGRLASDMYPLPTQVRFTIHQVVNTLNRLAGTDIANEEEDYPDYAAARAAVAQARELLSAHKAEAWLDAVEPVEFDLPNGMVFAMQAHEYVRDWSVPQFYFHLMATYAILRKEGLDVGKADYVPYMMRHLKAPA
ncbi:DUF1993 family protein [Parerythrobacter aestuarii]|uniref:DUF1993 family protein n=1 Tax=Parerythrobacter aestuarii TaxID=3020909 RepID=UPI0024DEA45F|nr:DUF1993 family protein [Parerythrobacter aestuarii]